jgi:hypoxanthine phosphoribosyltransferase
MPTILEWLAGETADGTFLPLEKVNVYRSRRQLPPLEREWDTSQPSRGLGDVVAKVTSAIGFKKGCSGCTERQNSLNTLWPFKYTKGYVPELVTLEKRSTDVKRLASLIPDNTRLIVGVARSGLSVATDLAMLRHIPIEVVNYTKKEVIQVGNGWRLDPPKLDPEGTILLVDDTCMTGNSFNHVEAKVREVYPNLKTGAVYWNPKAKRTLDYFSRELSWPHYLEWNMFNSVNVESMAFDFDGVFCHDCPPEMDDDGDRYLQFLRETRPRFLSKRRQVKLIVTARLEKYREETLNWLSRHGMSVRTMIMGPWKSLQERRRCNIGEWKATHVRKFLQTNSGIKPNTFVESDDWQAQEIAKRCGKNSGVIVCVDSAKCYLTS